MFACFQVLKVRTIKNILETEIIKWQVGLLFSHERLKRKVATFNQTQSVNFPLTIKILTLITVAKPLLLFALKLSQGKKEHKFSPPCLPSSNITAAHLPAFQSAIPDTEAFLSSTHFLSLCLWFFVGVSGGKECTEDKVRKYLCTY